MRALWSESVFTEVVVFLLIGHWLVRRKFAAHMNGGGVG
jgi:hypothetical protein